jgi:hypothetical protein
MTNSDHAGPLTYSAAPVNPELYREFAGDNSHERKIRNLARTYDALGQLALELLPLRVQLFRMLCLFIKKELRPIEPARLSCIVQVQWMRREIRNELAELIAMAQDPDFKWFMRSGFLTTERGNNA